MKCDVMLLEDYVEGFLDEQEMQKIEQHLKHCQFCQQQYKQLLDEQHALLAQLNTPVMMDSQADVIMQQLQVKTKRKKSWQTFQVSFISAAVLLLSFAFYYWNKLPNEMTEVANVSTEIIVTTDQQGTIGAVETKSESEPMLKASIEKVVEVGENTEIHFRLKFNDELYKQQVTLYEKLRSSYQYKDVDYSQMDHTLDDFYGNVQTSVKFAIRDEQGNLILSTKRIEGETPIMNNWSSSGDNTDVLGEWIYTTTVPTNTNPTTFEVLQMQAYIFDFNEADHNDENWQPFELNGQIYELESMESRHKTLHIKLSTKEKSENYRSGSWLLIANGKMHFISKLDTYVKNDRTIYNIQFEGFEEVPNPITFVPMTVFMKEELVEPIVLELR